eukprot:CAMPEP_0185795826 /NCGR_PEP_ID=MMETSP1174-20130828/160750_1 /TAXON_ID=35687 /ORGANISM="Dictyocha speculum, Strain CCMP1381" /LENGTH=41 /DNA_ID= /DNA_START= /DNA_END= /DNA_ORIENTATION=
MEDDCVDALGAARDDGPHEKANPVDEFSHSREGRLNQVFKQ